MDISGKREQIFKKVLFYPIHAIEGKSGAIFIISLLYMDRKRLEKLKKLVEIKNAVKRNADSSLLAHRDLDHTYRTNEAAIVPAEFEVSPEELEIDPDELYLVDPDKFKPDLNDLPIDGSDDEFSLEEPFRYKRYKTIDEEYYY